MDRYDRQLRLWGKSGQQQLESAHICIVGKETALLQETLKNLVLAGVSKFTWYCPDEETVKYATDGSSGPKQATSLFYADIVSDLNPLHPTGKVYIEQMEWSEPVSRTIQWDTFSLIILCGPLLLHSSGVPAGGLPPILKTYTRGLYGYIFIKLSTPHFILHTHPDYIVPNLGFRHPSPMLNSFMSDMDLEGIPNDKLAGVPYAVLLFKALRRVLSGKSDVSVGSIRKELESWYVGEINPQGIADLNYAEAVKFSHLAVLGYNGKTGNDTSEANKKNGVYTHLVASAKEYVAALRQVRNLNDKLAVLICCLGTFMEENDGEVVIDKNIPDMESDTVIYNKLKRVYQDWFECDFSRMLAIVRCHPLGKSIEDSLIREFCENTRKLGMTEFTTREILKDLYKDDEFSSYPVLETLLRSEQGMSTPAISPLERKALNFQSTYQTESFMGGIVAQEAIKLITHQFVPVDNIFIYDGLKNSTTTFAYR